MTPTYTLDDFDFALPRELIAQVPAARRGDARLLQVDGMRRADLAFTALPALLHPGDLLVFNDTRVVKARVFGEKSTGGKVELLLERVLGDHEALVQLRVGRAPVPGALLRLPGGAQATIAARDNGLYRLAFAGTGPLLDWFERHGHVPLPPYIDREAGVGDAARYQTVYARVPGAVAAPTAGLHFDQDMLASLAARDVGLAFITLHVGVGTFQPVKTNDLSQHRMHTERYSLPAATVDAIAATRARGRQVVAIGTTTLRALEAAALGVHRLTPGVAETALFVRPGFRFRVVDRLLTNFHLPKSTLLILVSAFAGFGAIRAAYAHAIAARYRFYSYGDALLVERDPRAGVK